MTEFRTADGTPIPLRSDVMATMKSRARTGLEVGVELPNFQLRKSGHSDMPRNARNLQNGVSVRAFVKKSAMFISVGI